MTTTDTVNNATPAPQTVGITLADTTTVSDALPASLSGNENTAISLSGPTRSRCRIAEHRRRAAHGADGVARHYHVGTLDGTTVVGGVNGSSSVTLSGTAAQITAALASRANYTGTPTITAPTAWW